MSQTGPLRGQAGFADDMAPRDALWLAFTRSPVAAGRITGLNTAQAAALPGVRGVHVGAQVAGLGALAVNPVMALSRLPDFPVLAQDRVSWAGQPVAAVLADSAAAAQDGAEAVLLDVADTDAPVGEVLAETTWHTGDVEAAFAAAAHVAEVTVRHPRLAPCPMEARAITVAHHADGRLTIWHSTQTPHRSRSELARILGVDRDRLRVIATDVGGAFGMKASLYPEEVFAVWAALHHRRSVRWQATRSEDFLAATHGRGLVSHGRLAIDAQGRFTALEARITAPLGPWLPNSALIPALNAGRVLPSGYAVDTVRITSRAETAPGGPTGIYRGAGRPEAVMLMERLVAEAGRITGQDALEIRRRNLRATTDLPARTPTGCTLDSGDYAAILMQLSKSANLPKRRNSQQRRRADGQLVGLGVAFYVENSGEGWESARVTLTGTGLHIASGSSAQGQSRASDYIKIASQATDIDKDNISVSIGDTSLCPEGIGALASRSTAIGGSAVLAACQNVIARRNAGEALPLTQEVQYENKGMAWGCGAMLVQLSIDRDTGLPTLEHVTCIDDAGTVIDPDQVLAQVQGGFAQGLGEALLEQIVYDADGQLLTGSLMDYALPRAADVPAIHLKSLHTPSPMNLLGAKGVGEAGTIAAPPAIVLAALDALAPLGVRDLDMPLTPETLWRAIRDAEDAR